MSSTTGTPRDVHRSIPWIVDSTGLLTSLLGIVVMVGWWSEIRGLVQLAPGLVPMQFNTALCFALSGALVLVARRTSSSVVSGLALVLFGFAAATLSQYVFGWELGLDEAFVEAFVTDQTSHPGRMAPNTAVGFVIVSVAGLLSVTRLKTGTAPLGGIGMMLISLASIAILGYLGGVEAAYGWGGYTRMAPHTAVGFTLVGAGLTAIGWNFDRPRGLTPTWLPAAITLAGLALSVALWQAFRADERFDLIEASRSKADAIASDLRQGMERDRLITRDLAGHWSVSDDGNERPWEEVVRSRLRGFGEVEVVFVSEPGVDSLIWVSTDSEASVARIDPTVWIPILDAIDIDGAAGEPRITPSFALPGGGRAVGMATLVPRDTGSDPFRLIFVTDATALVESWVGSSAIDGWSVRLVDEVGALYGSVDEASRNDLPTEVRTIDFAGASWSLRVVPNQAQVDLHSSPLPFLALVLGALLALAVGMTVSLAQKAERGREELQQHHDDLEVRVEERTAQLAEAVRELEAFSYSVSHDLRSPLRIVDGYSEILLRNPEYANDDEAATCLGHIRATVKRMGELIDGLLSFSRLGSKELTRGTVDMDGLVRAVVCDVRRAHPTWTAAVEVGALPEAVGDLDLLRQVYQNLLENAFKFSGDETEPRITVGFDFGRRGGCYYVRDNGVGFDMEYAEKLFGVFQRLHRSEDYAGTGVGLATAHRIVKRHGGEIWAHSEVGKGATFYFTLPDVLDEPDPLGDESREPETFEAVNSAAD